MKPPVPKDIDLRGFPYMPLHIVKLLNSDSWLRASGSEAKAMMTLWARSWHQVPAGSLPNDDQILRALAGVPDWDDVKKTSLRGFILCDDGRLYHPIICELALQAFGKREGYRRAAKSRWHKGNGATHMQRMSDA
jgi:hypothetical protein